MKNESAQAAPGITTRDLISMSAPPRGRHQLILLYMGGQEKKQKSFRREHALPCERGGGVSPLLTRRNRGFTLPARQASSSPFSRQFQLFQDRLEACPGDGF